MLALQSALSRAAGTPCLALVLSAAVACGGNTATTPSMATTSTATTGTGTSTSTASTLTLSSPALQDGGVFAAKYICAARTGLTFDTNLPLAWTAPPSGTVGYALLMTTIAKDASGTTTKYNWVLYDIPVTALAIPEFNTVIVSGNTGTTLVGTPGVTSDGPLHSYSPPCSAVGSGLRTYTFTLYALSARPTLTLAHNATDGPTVAAAIAPLTLASASIRGNYTF